VACDNSEGNSEVVCARCLQIQTNDIPNDVKCFSVALYCMWRFQTISFRVAELQHEMSVGTVKCSEHASEGLS